MFGATALGGLLPRIVQYTPRGCYGQWGLVVVVLEDAFLGHIVERQIR